MSLAMKARQKVKKKIVKDKIFGCDLLEHLQMSGQEVPQVLKSCAEFVEEHGIVDGIYRLCGIASNVQKLRQEFNIERPPDLNKSTYLQDVHCVSSLCKAYFRELPNPLLTYQLYDKFADAVAIQLEEQRLIKIREVLKELPLPHYRTLEYLMRHLLRMASYSAQTNMHARNLAIVWAPNLLRSKDIESSGFNGTAAFMEVRVQSIVVEFILTHVEQLFGDWTNYGKINEGSNFASMNWPTYVPEDYYRSLSYNLPNKLNHGDGPPQMRPYHTIIELSDHKRKGSLKAKKWKSIFNLGRSNPDSKRKSQKQDDKDDKTEKMSLRPAKSMDSLSSMPHATHASDLEQNSWALRSPRNQVPLRRESLGSPSKAENTEFIFTDSEEQLHSDTIEVGHEEEEELEGGQVKSEPTTPKPGRSSITGNPTGRSPKSNPSRAEKCVGVHISGPFSVTLPFHITSNLSRLTRGMECSGLSIMAPQRSSDKFFTLESDDTHKARPSQGANEECDQHSGSEVTEEPGQESTRISIEVQDTFSFLDAPDTSIEKAPENTLESEVLGYELEAENKTEEFSVEPPPDDLCTGDEQAYFMPTGFVDETGHWRRMEESLEDIYLSANDDLSPKGLDLKITFENMLLSSEEQQCTLHATLPKDEVDRTMGEEQLMLQQVAYSQEHSLTATPGVPNIVVEVCQHSDPEDGAINEASREESEHTRSHDPNIAEQGIRGGQNVDMSSPENSPSVSTPEHTQPDQTNEVQSANGEELEDRAGICMDSSVEQYRLQAAAQQSMADGLLSNTPVEDGGSKDEDSNEKVPYSQDTADTSADPLYRNTSENGVSRIIPGQQSDCTEGRAAADHEATTEDQCCSEKDPPPCLYPSVEDAIRYVSGQQMIMKRKENSQQEESANEADVRTPDVSLPLVELAKMIPYKMHSDGSVAVKLMAITNKVQQAKSVPVVPPKPQFAMLPPALKSKIQAGSPSANSRSQKLEESSHMEVPETSNEAAMVRRSSWRSTTSISFDTAMAMAKERQSQNPVRRMHTYCMGDLYDITDTSKADHSSHAPRFTVQSASSRMHRPFSCMALSCAEGELHGLHTREEPIHGLQSICTHEPDAYSREVPHRNRLSMPRLGLGSVGDEQSKCHQQRRSLL